jgi:hypothetical protein
MSKENRQPGASEAEGRRGASLPRIKFWLYRRLLASFCAE